MKNLMWTVIWFWDLCCTEPSTQSEVCKDKSVIVYNTERGKWFHKVAEPELMERIREVMRKSLTSSKVNYADLQKNYLDKEWHSGPLLLCKTMKLKENNQEERTHIIVCHAWFKEAWFSCVCVFWEHDFLYSGRVAENCNRINVSGPDFIWVVRRGKIQNENEDCMSRAF